MLNISIFPHGVMKAILAQYSKYFNYGSKTDFWSHVIDNNIIERLISLKVFYLQQQQQQLTSLVTFFILFQVYIIIGLSTFDYGNESKLRRLCLKMLCSKSFSYSLYNRVRIGKKNYPFYYIP